MRIYDRALNADTLRWEITGNEAEKTYLSIGGGAFRCDLTGPEVCGSLQGVHNYSESTRAAGGIYEYTLLNHSCNENSYLKFFINLR